MSQPDNQNVPTHPGEIDATQRLARRPWPTTRLNPKINVSFEFFPPATEAGLAGLSRCAEVLAPLAPSFVSVTYGAGGSTQERTKTAVASLIKTTGLPVAGHLTCAGATKEVVNEVIDHYAAGGVRHIVALRGDAPAGMADGAVDGGYADAAELVAAIRRRLERSPSANFEISVAAYPEVHPKAVSPMADMDNLKRKLDAGADRAITQFFFDTDVFLRFLDNARSAGITAPIVPGIMPVTNFKGISGFAKRCGTNVPPWMHELFGDLEDAPEMHQLVAATVAAEQCRRLAESGVSDFHFYTMNKPQLTAATCRILGVKPAPAAAGGSQPNMAEQGPAEQAHLPQERVS